jgi:group I intron endonuclease
MKSGIYKITNKITGKCYVGSAVNINKRWSAHKKMLERNTHHSKILQNSVNKHGYNNFIFEVIELCDREILIEREQHWIDVLDSYVNGYNQRPIADNNLGLIQKSRGLTYEEYHGHDKAKKIKEKLSESHKGKSPSNKLELDIELIKKLYVDENKTAKEVAEILGCSQTPILNRLRKHNLIRKGKDRYNEQTIKKQSESLKLAYHEGRFKGMLGKTHTEETKKKMSKSSKTRHLD